MAPYFAAHAEVLTGGAARGPTLFQVDEVAPGWAVRQVLDDPAGDHDWAITATVDLPASEEEGEPVVVLEDVGLL